MVAYSGWGRWPADGGGGGGNSFFSSAASSKLGGSGQLNPAAPARFRKRRTVPLPSTQIFEICRSLSRVSKCKRRTSLIFRMGVLSWGNMISFGFKRPHPPRSDHPAPPTPPARSDGNGAPFRHSVGPRYGGSGAPFRPFNSNRPISRRNLAPLRSHSR